MNSEKKFDNCTMYMDERKTIYHRNQKTLWYGPLANLLYARSLNTVLFYNCTRKHWKHISYDKLKEDDKLAEKCH